MKKRRTPPIRCSTAAVQYLIRVDQAAALLREIGILTADGKLKNDMIRKYNQIDHYVELVAPMFEQDDSDEIVLLDCACGKSYLSFVMNYYHARGAPSPLPRDRRGYQGARHRREPRDGEASRLSQYERSSCADLRVYQPPKNVTAVISLHACDIATDLALGDSDPRQRRNTSRACRAATRSCSISTPCPDSSR